MVGIPSFKNAATIGYVVRAAQAGLVQYFPDLHPVLVNADAGSPDGTGRVVIETEPPDYIEQILLVRPRHKLQRISLTYPEIEGVGGKGAALRTIFEIAAALEVQALVVVDSDLRSIVPEWIELLAGPILKGGYDFVAPLYARYKYDGTITNTVTYPLTRALYGHRIRQPIGGDFGVSGDLVRHYLDARRLDARRQQVRHRHLDDDLGDHRRVRGLPDPAGRQGPRPQGPRLGPGADVPPGRRHDPAARRPLRRTTGWRIHGSHDVPAYGFERIIDPPPLEVNTLRLLSEFHAGSLTLADTWRSMLAPTTVATVLELAAEAGRLGETAAARARHRRRRGVDHGDDPRDGRGGQHVPLPRRRLGPRHLRPRGRAPGTRSPRSRRWSRRSCRSTSGASARFVIENRAPDDRPGRGSRRAPGARVRAAQAVPRRPLGRRRATPGCRVPMSPRSPLPARILIPVANPRTAEDLIRIGAAMLDPRAGALSALGIVEVPEGMPLSEGATRARHARRLLQRVLDFAPDGTTIHPIVRIGRHAAEGIIEAAAEEEADLIIFGWGGKTPAGRDAGTARPSSRRPSTRSCATRRATSRSSSSAARARSSASSSRSAAARTPSWRCASPTRSPTYHGATVVVLHVVPAGITMAVRAQAERALQAFIKQHLQRQGRGRPARGTQRPQRDPARGREGRPRGDGRVRRAGRRGRGIVPVRVAPRDHRHARQADRRRRQDPRDRSRGATFDQLAAKAETPRGRRPRRRGGTRGPDPGRALVRRIELPSRRVRRPASPRRAQGEAGRHDLAGPADAERGGDDRPDRPRAPSAR